MTFTESIKTCLGKYVTFSGRARPSEFWWFFLASVVGGFAFGFIDAQMFGFGTLGNPAPQPLSMVYKLAIFLPMLAVGFHRLQDTGRPGWLIFLPIMVSLAFMFLVFGGVVGVSMMQNAGISDDMLRGPAALMGMSGMLVVGIAQLVIAVLFIWWLTRPSQPGSNKYGPNPSEVPS